MHGSYKTEAVVLRSLRLGEADRVLHLYTPSRGRVGAVAKGVRRTRSRVGARLEPFSHVALVLHEGRGELHTISGVDTLATHHAVREQPERARIAGACGEALLKMFAEGDPSPRVFAALCRLLDVLDDYAPAAGRRRPRSAAARLPAQAARAGGLRPAARGLRGLRGRGRAARALLGGRRRRRVRLLPGRRPAAARRASRRWPLCSGRRSPSCPRSPRTSPRPSRAAPPISMPSTAASACARWR